MAKVEYFAAFVVNALFFSSLHPACTLLQVGHFRRHFLVFTNPLNGDLYFGNSSTFATFSRGIKSSRDCALLCRRSTPGCKSFTVQDGVCGLRDNYVTMVSETKLNASSLRPTFYADSVLPPIISCDPRNAPGPPRGSVTTWTVFLTSVVGNITCDADYTSDVVEEQIKLSCSWWCGNNVSCTPGLWVQEGNCKQSIWRNIYADNSGVGFA